MVRRRTLGNSAVHIGVRWPEMLGFKGIANNSKPIFKKRNNGIIRSQAPNTSCSFTPFLVPLKQIPDMLAVHLKYVNMSF